MATPLEARKITVFYPGGSVRAPRATIQKLLGNVATGWSVPITDTDVEKRRPYGSRQRTGSAAGQPMKVIFTDGEQYTFRITGTHKAFIANMLAEGAGASVQSIVSARGTEYGNVPVAAVP